MKPEPGAPAFDNIDDLLADKIVNHGRNHADRTTADDPSPTGEASAVSPESEEPDAEQSVLSIIAAALAICTVLLILYRLFNRKPHR